MSALEQWLVEQLLAHGVDMLRAEAEAKAQVLALMIGMQKDIVSQLANADSLSEMGKADKNALLRESNAVIADYYGQIQQRVDLFGVAEVEALGVKYALGAVIDRAAGEAGAEVRLGMGLPTDNYLRKLASDTLIQGSPAKAWWVRQEQDTAFRLANEIRTGAAQGETNAQIIKRIVGTEVTAKAVPALEEGRLGIMPLARRNAAAIVQTSMQAVAAAARRATFQLNRDITNGIMQLSTLDSHTSLTCIAYSGAQWDLDYQPINGTDLPYNGGVPRHWNCRSTEVAIMKTLREMGIDMDEPDPGQRATAGGPISAKTTFADFLKLKGAAYQDEVLGPGRAELFRAGKLTPRDLVDMRGQPLKLDDLRAKYDPVKSFKQPKGEFTIYDPGYKRVAADVSTPARTAAVKFEEGIRRDDHETGAFFGKDGALLMMRSGSPNQITYTEQELGGMRGAVFTHNHPNGMSFSVDDITSGAFARLAEVRAVTPGYRHIMQPDGAWPAEAAIERMYSAEISKAYSDVDTMVRSGELSSRYATAEIHHLAWVRAAVKLGLIYIREAS